MGERLVSADLMEEPSSGGSALQVPSDEVLMRRISESDRDAFRILMHRHWEGLVGCAHAITGAMDPAEDVAQKAFVRVWRGRRRWTESGTVTGYLYRITRNLALNARRDASNESRRRDRAGRAQLDDPVADSPEAHLELARLEHDIGIAVAALSPRRREIFVLSRFHGLSHREIAEALEVSPQTVANQMTAALMELRQALADHVDSGPP